MKKILRKTLNLLGEKHRLQIYRKLVSIPKAYYDPDYTVEIAKSLEDLHGAYKLLHDCYVGIKIIDPQPSGLRCNLHSFLPTTTIIVAKYKGQVVGTVSAIKDSSSGLPSDQDFQNENDRFRRQGKTLVEASALAVAPPFRGNHSVSFLLMKYLYNYCRNCFRGDYMIGAVHPKSEDFYKALWQFKKNGSPIQYGSLKGAAAIHISMDLSPKHFQKVIRDFGPDDADKNFGSMIMAKDSRFLYPNEKEGLSIHPVITPEMLKHFCLEQKEVWSRLSTNDQKTLIQVYSTYFGYESMNAFRWYHAPLQVEQEYRTPVQLSSVVSLAEQSSFCEILDITSGGCYLSWEEDLPEAGQTLKVSFRLGGHHYVVQGQVAWKNDNLSLSRQRGIGIRFLRRIPTLNLQLQQWAYDSNLTSDLTLLKA
jgi:hypothetical protein